MSSVKKKVNKKTEIDKKNSPKKNKNEEKQKMIKIPPINIDNKITNEPIEKEMLKGQEHKDHIEEVENKEIENMDKNIETNGQENLVNIPINEEVEQKNIIQIKPRETYLKEKMMKLNYSEKLLSNINKSLDIEVQKLHDEIIDNQILITAVPKVFDKKDFLYNSSSPLDPKKINNEKTNLKILKDLRDESDIIKKNLNKILENEKLIKDESLSKIYSLKQSQSNLSLEKILKIEKLKVLQKQKEKLLQQLNDIEFKINEIMGDNINNENTRKNKLKTFLDNFERDKEIAEIRAKKYFHQFKKINKRMENDIKQVADKVKKELEEKEKEDKKKKLDILEEFKKKERAIQQKRYKEYMKKALIFKNFMAEKPKLKLNEYLYNKNLEKFTQEEDKAIRLENNKRKELMKSISREEFKVFALNYDAKKEKIKNQTEEKTIKLTEEWKKRRNLLPTYVSSFSEAAKAENKNREEEEILKNEKMMELINKKKNYCKILKEEKQPVINKKLRQKKLDEINRLENPKQYFIKNTLTNKKNKRIILKKRDPDKPSKFKWKLKLELDPFDNFNNSDTANDILIKKPKKIKISSSFEKKEHKQQEKKPDYLRQIINKRLEKKSMSNKNILLTPKNTAEKWEKIINKFKGNIVNNVNNIQQKVDVIDREVINKEKKLKFEGGMGYNPELGQEISNLLLDSIGAKLSLLNKLAKM